MPTKTAELQTATKPKPISKFRGDLKRQAASSDYGGSNYDRCYPLYLVVAEYLTRTLPEAMQPKAAMLLPLATHYRGLIESQYRREFGVSPAKQTKRKGGTVTPFCTTFPTVRHKMPESGRGVKSRDSTAFYQLVNAGVLSYVEPVKSFSMSRGLDLGAYTIATAYLGKLLTKAEVTKLVCEVNAPRILGTMTRYKVDPLLLSDDNLSSAGPMGASPQLRDFAIGKIKEITIT